VSACECVRVCLFDYDTLIFFFIFKYSCRARESERQSGVKCALLPLPVHFETDFAMCGPGCAVHLFTSPNSFFFLLFSVSFFCYPPPLTYALHPPSRELTKNLTLSLCLSLCVLTFLCSLVFIFYYYFLFYFAVPPSHIPPRTANQVHTVSLVVT